MSSGFRWTHMMMHHILACMDRACFRSCAAAFVLTCNIGVTCCWVHLLISSGCCVCKRWLRSGESMGFCFVNYWHPRWSPGNLLRLHLYAVAQPSWRTARLLDSVFGTCWKSEKISFIKLSRQNLLQGSCLWQLDVDYLGQQLFPSWNVKMLNELMLTPRVEHSV